MDSSDDDTDRIVIHNPYHQKNIPSFSSINQKQEIEFEINNLLNEARDKHVFSGQG